MARPTKSNADYFSHDSDMRNDKKVKAIRRKFGHLGYSIWVMLLEVLTNENDFILEWDELNIELIAGDFDIESNDLIEIISYFEKLKMIEINEKTLFCKKLVDRFEGLLSKRKRNRIGVMDVHNSKEKEFRKQKVNENPQSKVKESKVKESKENKKKSFSFTTDDESETISNEIQEINESAASEKKIKIDFVPPNVEQVSKEFTRLCKEKKIVFDTSKVYEVANEFFEYYNDKNWCYKNSGNKIKNWKAPAKNWHSTANFEEGENQARSKYNGNVIDITPFPENISLGDDLPY